MSELTPELLTGMRERDSARVGWWACQSDFDLHQLLKHVDQLVLRLDTLTTERVKLEGLLNKWMDRAESERSRLSSFLLPWRAELPSECGWYWHRPSTQDDDIVTLKGVLSSERANGDIAFFVDHRANTVETIGGEWAGPIPKPQPLRVVERQSIK